MTDGRISEEDIARVVVAHFRANGWTVYQEVRHSYYRGSVDHRADIVAEKDGVLHVVEVKRCFTKGLWRQIQDWRYYANYVSVAVQHPVNVTTQHTLRVCRASDAGIGVLYVLDGRVLITVEPRKCEVKIDNLRDCLRVEQQEWAAAGNADGKFFSQYQDTCKQLFEIVQASPGILLTDAVPQIKHHYHTDKDAISCLGQWARIGTIRGIERRKEKGRIRLYPKE